MMKAQTKAAILTTALALAGIPIALATEPHFTVQLDKNTHTFSRSELEASPYTSKVTISNNRAYLGKRMTYTAVKLCKLLKPLKIDPKATLEFIATDQFAVLIPAQKILNCSKKDAIAYLAIEPQSKWPKLNNHTNTTAGPFDVIWVNPEKSHISDEYWAWSVIKIKAHQTVSEAIVIKPPKTNRPSVQRGYQFYVSHCAACHTINHIGQATIGPDLSDPKNPLEYYPDKKVLRQFIRDPKSVRQIKNGRMSGSSKEFLTDAELDDLIEYFKYMQKHRH